MFIDSLFIPKCYINASHTPTPLPCNNAVLFFIHLTAGRTSYLVRTNDEATTSTQPTKKARRQTKVQKHEAAYHSDGYSSDTDVDDPDEEEMDTDEEKAISLSPVKPNKDKEKASNTRQGSEERRDQTTGGIKPCNADDSQELFNASLEAELYTDSTMMAKQGTATTSSTIKSVSQPPPQLTRSKIAEVVMSPTTLKPKTDCDDDTQMSILYDLF